MMEERRSSVFTERLSIMILCVAAAGGFIVLLDPSLQGKVLGFDWKIGIGEFSEGLKGAVINTMMLGGWTALIAYWLRPREDEEKTKALTRIAEQSAPVAAAAAFAAAAAPVPSKADTVNMPAEQVNVNEEKPK